MATRRRARRTRKSAASRLLALVNPVRAGRRAH
jgi:hypothetical protein